MPQNPVVMKVENLEELLADFRKAPKIVRKEVGKAMDRALKHIQNLAQTYPPAPPGSSYRRTGTLARRWNTRVQTSRAEARGLLENPTPYGPFVMSDEQQAAMHAGRWKTESGLVKEAQDDVDDFFGEALDNVRRALDR